MEQVLPQRPGGLALTQHALNFCQFSQNDIIIDIGCGHGHSVQLLRQRGFCAFGIDKQLYTTLDCQADATKLPFAAQSLHGIISECVVSLLQKPQVTLEHWWVLCKENAYLLIHDVYALSKNSQALKASTLEKYLQESGWNIIHKEDCSQHMKAYAAQLLWHGACCQDLYPWQHCGYGLWIAQKNI